MSKNADAIFCVLDYGKRCTIVVTVAVAQDSDDEDMTDEQMFKMDKLLAAVLRTQKDAKDKSKTTKQVSALLLSRKCSLAQSVCQLVLILPMTRQCSGSVSIL